MAVDDLWYLTKRGPDGERQKSARHGRGKRWRVRYLDDSGRKREELFEKKSDAERRNAAVRADLDRGQYVDSRAGRLTVAEYAEQWRVRQLHADTTTVRVETAIRLHIAATPLAKLAVNDTKPGHIKTWVKDRSTVLAPTTLRVVYSYLVSMFTEATLERRIGTTPCVGIRLPDIERHAHVIPTPDQVHAIAEALSFKSTVTGQVPLSSRRYAALVYVAAGCGLRLGEALGLEVGDVDFLRRELHVRKALKVVTGRKPYLGPLKTKTSRRTVELPDVVAQALARHIELFRPEPRDIDDDTDPRHKARRPATLLFTGMWGEPVHSPTFYRSWAPAVRSVGMPARWGYHGLRHYYATLLIHAGASVKTVQLALGHSNPTITLNTYVGEWPEALDRTRSLVDATLGTKAAVKSARRGA